MSKRASLLAFVVCLLFCLLPQVSLAIHVTGGPTDQTCWKRIDAYLRENEPHTSGKDNMRTALRYLQLQRRTLTRRATSEIKIIKRLEMLESLKTMIKKRQCGPKANEMRKELLKTTDTHLYPRVRVIYRFYAPSLSLVCQTQYYSKIYRNRKRQLDQEAFKPMHLFAREVIANELGTLTQVDKARDLGSEQDEMRYFELAKGSVRRVKMVDKLLSQEQKLDSETNGMIGRKVIEHYIPGVADGEGGGASIKEFFNQLVVGPCRNYTETIGLDLFEEAKKDLYFLGRIHLSNMVEEGMPEYLLALYEIKICKLLLEDKFERAKLTRKVVRSQIGSQSGSQGNRI